MPGLVRDKRGHDGESMCRPLKDAACWRADQSSGSTFTIEGPWLLPTQKVTGVVQLSTHTRRTLVFFGRCYSVACPVFGSSRTTRSFAMPAVHSSPFLSGITSYG